MRMKRIGPLLPLHMQTSCEKQVNIAKFSALCRKIVVTNVRLNRLTNIVIEIYMENPG